MPHSHDALWLALLLAGASFGATVRVQPTPGGPQLMVDGQPIPPRFFWGSPRGGILTVGPEWSEQAFTFRPSAPVDACGTLHFRFEHKPGEVELRDVRIVDVASGEDVLPPGTFATPAAFAQQWRVWPQAEKNTVGTVAVKDGGLHVTLANPPNGSWPDFHLYCDVKLSFAAEREYRVSFRVKADPARRLSPAVYHVVSGVYNSIGGPPGQFLHQVELARDAGVRLVSFSAPNCWTPPDEEVNWRPLDDLCRSLIQVHPKVLLVPRVSGNAPGWWLDAHPAARMLYEGGQPGRMASVSDRQYRTAAAAQMELLSRHLTAAFPDHYAGLHPCGQNTGEWFYEDSWSRPLSGYDPATVKAFREWLTARGLPAADPPSPEARHAAPQGLLRDPAKERLLVEFARFQQREMADFVVALAQGCRRGDAGTKLVVFFYGYNYEFNALSNGAPVSGHYDLRRVLDDGTVDILCSPISYFDRAWPGTGPCMTSAESVRDAGILWLNEDDTRTYLDTSGKYGHVDTLEHTRDVMLRNTAQEALRGFGSWWMDLMGEGWYDDARIWQVISQLAPVDQAMAHRTQPFTPEIASILDEDSECHLAGGANAFSRPGVYQARAAFGRCGAPYGQYLLDDAVAGKVPAKLQVFLATWALTAEQRAALAKTRRPGTSRVWCYAPGYCTPEGNSLEAMQALTGFEYRPVQPSQPQVTPTAAGRAAGLTEPWGPQAVVNPLFTVDATGAEVWATYADSSPAAVVRPGPQGFDAFIGVPAWTPALVRALAQRAGVHLFCTVDAGVWAAGDYLMVQPMQAGKLSVDVGRAGAVGDALTGEGLGTGPMVTLDLREGETRVLKY